MSDDGNVVYPQFPPKPGQDGGSGGAGGPPHDPLMDARVAALETDMRDVKATLGRMEPVLARMSEKMDHMATSEALAGVRGDVQMLGEKISGQDTRLKAVESAINDTVKSAVSKAIGPWQLPGVLLLSGGVVVALVAALNWVVHQPWFAR